MGRVIATAAMLALSACSHGQPLYSDLAQLCKADGFVAGSADFDRCVSAKRQAELRQVYDLAIRPSG